MLYFSHELKSNLSSSVLLFPGIQVTGGIDSKAGGETNKATKAEGTSSGV